LVVIGIAATVLVAQQQQEIRKRAVGCGLERITPTLTGECTQCLLRNGAVEKELKKQDPNCSIEQLVTAWCKGEFGNEDITSCNGARSEEDKCKAVCPPPPPGGVPPGNGGPPSSGTNPPSSGNPPVPSTSCRVSWVLDPNPQTSPANTNFTAYIKGELSQNGAGFPDWSHVGLKFDNGNLGTISDIKNTGSLGPLTGCSADQPCFKSNVLSSGAVNSQHNLVFSILNGSVSCTPPKPFTTGAGGPPPPGGGGGARLLLALNLEGFTGTYTPKRDTEAITVLVRSQEGTISAVESIATFSATHRHFRKLIDLPADLSDGIYELLLKGASTLRRTFGNITVTKNRETFVPFDPAKPLLSCDLNNDNLINMLDLNQLYTDIKKPKAEHKDSLGDITRDGVIDIFDHNFCVQNFLKIGERP